jgi:hypothetical protein
VSDYRREIPALHTCLFHDIYPGHCQAPSVRVRANRGKLRTSSLIVIVGLRLDSNTRSSLSLKWVNLRLIAEESLIPGSPESTLNKIGLAGVKWCAVSEYCR